MVERGGGTIEGNITLCDEDGVVIAELLGVECRALPSVNRDPAEWSKRCTYRPEWMRADRDRDALQCDASRWLIFSDDGIIGEQVAHELLSQLLSRFPVPDVELISRSSVHGDIERAIAEHPDVQRVVYLWPLDDAAGGIDPTESQSTLDFLSLIQALARREGGDALRVYVVTKGAHAIAESDAVCMSQAGIVGLARTALTEHPDMRCTLIDIDAEFSGEIAFEIAEELLCDSGETEIGLRGVERYVSLAVLQFDLALSLRRAVRLHLPDAANRDHDRTIVGPAEPIDRVNIRYFLEQFGFGICARLVQARRRNLRLAYASRPVEDQVTAPGDEPQV